MLSFLAAPNFEAPSDFDDDGNYKVEVIVNDGNGGSTRRVIDVTVEDVNDAPEVVTSSLVADENQTSAGTIAATDQDGNVLNCSLTGDGADDAQFSIDPTTGALSFISAPDFENSTTTSPDGVYQVEVAVDDGAGGVVSRLIDVTVRDINDAPVIVTASLVADENQTSAGSVAATDQDGDTLTYALAAPRPRQ